MVHRVIQGFFANGAVGLPAASRPAVRACSPPSAFARAPAAVQGRPGAAAPRAPGLTAAQLGITGGGGAPLPGPLRTRMEAALRADFSAVRVHVGPQAGRLGAVAFTTGPDIYFAPGRYQPDTPDGQRLLGHELAHVLQQRQGRVRVPAGCGLAVVRDAALEAEADRLGLRAAAHPARLQATAHPVPVRPPPQAPAAQRSPMPRSALAALAFAAPRPHAPSANAAVPPARPPAPPPVRAAQVVQLAKRKKSDDDDDAYVPPQGKSQQRWTFSRQTVEAVVRARAHLRSNTAKGYTAVWTCPGCKRPLAFHKHGSKAFGLVRRDFTSKKGHFKKQRALEIDHFPRWAERERALKGRGATLDEIRKDHDDPAGLRALCRACNGSHKYEKTKKVDYMSEDDEEGYVTDDNEPENKGFYAPFRFDPPPPPPPTGGILV